MNAFIYATAKKGAKKCHHILCVLTLISNKLTLILNKLILMCLGMFEFVQVEFVQVEFLYDGRNFPPKG